MNRNLFLTPPADCRIATFWAWNGDLTPEETRRQVRDMAEHGMGGGFMHARSGLLTEYLGQTWFDNCEAAIEEGKQAGFHPWIYDEDRWPSGSCGGATAEANPDYRARGLLMECGSERFGYVDMPTCAPGFEETTCLGRFRIIRSIEGRVEFRPATSAESGDGIASFNMAVWPRSGWLNDGFSADVFHPGAVREFICNTYEVYAERLQRHFGKEVPGIFTDEPRASGYLPWSAILPDEFRRRRGYDLIPQLPALFFGTAHASEVRHDYWKTLYELFNENYMGQIGAWCRKHGLAFTGHLMRESDIWGQMLSGGGAMAHYAHMDIPGIDILREQISEVATCKQASSICAQFDKRVMISELYGATGYNFTFEGQKWLSDWQMALGVNMLCPHLSHYTMKGCAKRDYPPSYSYQSPWWRHYRHIADYQARLCYALRQGHPVRDILLIHPLTGAWCEFNPLSAGTFGLGQANQRWHETMGHLLALHRDFDLGDELLMAQHAKVDGTDLQLGRARYSVVIVPPAANIESTTLDILEEFVARGGKLLFLHPVPALVDGLDSTRPGKLASGETVHRAGLSRRELREALDALLPRRVSVAHPESGEEASAVLCQQRELADGFLFFLANTDRECGHSIRLRVPCAGAWERWDPEKGRVEEIPSAAGSCGAELQLALPPAGSALLCLVTAREPSAPAPCKRRRVREKLISPDTWRFQRMGPNSLVLDRCAYRLDARAFSREMFLGEAQEEWHNQMGLPSHALDCLDVQAWKRLQNPENLRTMKQLTLRYVFDIERVPASETFLVLEEREECNIALNGEAVNARAEGWFMDRAFQKVPVFRFLRRGRNVLEIGTTLTPIRVMEDIYLIGDFGVDIGTMRITREPRRLRPGDWSAQGYPFYADAMMYTTTFRVPPTHHGSVRIALGRFEGAVAAIWVNGNKAGVCGWRPYEADVTPFSKPGRNTLGIEVVGSARNLMGPRHTPEQYPSWVGPLQLADTTERSYHFSPAGLYSGVRILFGDPISSGDVP